MYVQEVCVTRQRPTRSMSVDMREHIATLFDIGF